MAYGYKNHIPEMLVIAQELQKAREYERSRDMYMKFFNTHPKHCMRFKALFEAADNLYYEEKYKEAAKAYNKFLKYCDEEDNPTDEEKSWIDAYKELSGRRLRFIEEHEGRDAK